ncbi:hypothetical protein, partial [Petrimonas sp.]|uniref:hypothetical protein n=1 Tax=Petrimonas sp. TaxID=2023866 RepID=UPI003325E442
PYRGRSHEHAETEYEAWSKQVHREKSAEAIVPHHDRIWEGLNLNGRAVNESYRHERTKAENLYISETCSAE